MNILVTGGAGFIGSAFIRYVINNTSAQVTNLDCLTYAANLNSLNSIADNERYNFVQGNICNGKLLKKLLTTCQPDLVIHLAAESHVDRSIDSAANFIDTNIVGTYQLLESVRAYWQGLDGAKQQNFRFHHVSTDEVFGDLGPDDAKFNENTAYQPSSPYSASKAASDHLVKAWYRTYGLPIVMSNCSNNYGPFQYPEKLIPVTILNALNGLAIPIYGQGTQVRDWLHVDDHVAALFLVATKGRLGETYNIGGNNECQNIEVVEKICHLMDEMVPQKLQGRGSFQELITHVEDRLGHDVRYAVAIDKIQEELDWTPQFDFEQGLRQTVLWYLSNQAWLDSIDDNDMTNSN